MDRDVTGASAAYADTDREQALDAAAAGVVIKPGPSRALDQAIAGTLLLQDLRRILRAVAARRSEATARTVRPLDVRAGLVERFRDELEAEAAMPRSQKEE